MIQPNSLFKICIAFVVACMAGCTQNSSTPVDPIQTSHLTYQPKGTISGLIKNAITATPVAGAVISVGYEGGVQSTTSDGAGAFSFANVPAGKYQIVNNTFVATGTYIMTVSLVDYNANQTDPAKKYRDYYYSSVTITFTSLAPGDSLAVTDLVGATHLDISYLNTTVTGQVVDQNQQPVANATVMLYDATVAPNVLLAQTTSSATGGFLFSAVDNGLTITIKARSSDGSLDGTLSNFTLPANVTADSLRSQFTAERIMLTPTDNVNPTVISITPENNSDVSFGGIQVVYKFSEPIKQKAYTRTDLPPGHSTIIDDITFTYVGLKKSAAAITFSAQWNAAFTQLTLTPTGIIGSAKYNVNAQPAFAKLTDNANKAVIDNTFITGDFDLLQFTTNGSSSVPAAPTLTRRFISGLFNSLDFNGGTVGLEWNYDANARSYNIYRSINGGTFDLLQSDFFGTQFTATTGSLVIPSGAADPLSPGYVQYVVRAVSKDLVESPSSNRIIVEDDVAPRLTTASVAAGGGTFKWIYTLRFSEPLTISTAKTTANYSIPTFGGVSFTVDGASYLGNSAGAYIVRLDVTSTGALPVGYSLLASNVKDLKGNTMSTTSITF